MREHEIAICRPSPDEAPVTSTVLPARLNGFAGVVTGAQMLIMAVMPPSMMKNVRVIHRLASDW